MDRLGCVGVVCVSISGKFFAQFKMREGRGLLIEMLRWKLAHDLSLSGHQGF